MSDTIPKWPSLSSPHAATSRRAAASRRSATRRDILDAAQRLFEGQGYAATTMAAIADEAGVALKTVYVAFETKAGVLRALWHLLLRGDQEDVPVAEPQLVPRGARGARSRAAAARGRPTTRARSRSAWAPSSP